MRNVHKDILFNINKNNLINIFLIFIFCIVVLSNDVLIPTLQTYYNVPRADTYLYSVTNFMSNCFLDMGHNQRALGVQPAQLLVTNPLGCCCFAIFFELVHFAALNSAVFITEFTKKLVKSHRT